MSETSLMRREPRGFWCDTLHTMLVGVLVLGALATAHITLKGSFRYLWYDLQAVTVPDHPVGSDPLIVADRSIRSDFWGSWSVTVREAETHRFICMTAAPEPIRYRSAASAANPRIGPLSEWMADATHLRDCELRGMTAGRFYLDTCHHVLAANVWPVWRCVESNRFTRVTAEE